MKNFISIDDISDFNSLIDESISIKKNPFKYSHLGEKKAIGLIFFNKSLRTRLSMQKAAEMIGLKCFVMNFNNEGWNLEFENNAIMSTDKAEHIKEAAMVLSQYSSGNVLALLRLFVGLPPGPCGAPTVL